MEQWKEEDDFALFDCAQNLNVIFGEAALGPRDAYAPIVLERHASKGSVPASFGEGRRRILCARLP